MGFLLKLINKKPCFWILWILITHMNNIFPLETQIEFRKYCREENRPITSEENDEYLLVDAEIDSTIILACHFCNASVEESKLWYYQDRYQTAPEKEVEIGMDDNVSYNQVHMTADLSLIIKNFEAASAGIYRCHGVEGQEKEKKFNYRLEREVSLKRGKKVDGDRDVILLAATFKDRSDFHIEEGNITDWQKYQETYLSSVTTRFAISRMTELKEIRERGIILEVISEWNPWGPCQNCTRGQGYRTRKGYCRLKSLFSASLSPNNSNKMSSVERRQVSSPVITTGEDFIVNFFRKSPLLPCKSLLLREKFPNVGIAVRYLPEFVLREACKTCPAWKAKQRKRKKETFKYEKRYVLTEGAYLTVSCPESSTESRVTWKKDFLPLDKAIGSSFRKKHKESRIMLDAFSTLYLFEISKNEEGDYMCYIDDVKMMRMKVIVVSKSRILTEAFLRHLKYVGLIFLLTSFAYCTGLIFAWRHKSKFKSANDATSDTNETLKPETISEKN